MSKAGKTAPTDVGAQHPSPEKIPHHSNLRTQVLRESSLVPSEAHIIEKVAAAHAAAQATKKMDSTKEEDEGEEEKQ